MRNVKKFGVLTVAFFTISVIGVATASAAQFTYSAPGNLRGHAVSGTEGKQVFTTGAGNVTCTTAEATGEITAFASSEQEFTVNYKTCTAFGIVNVDITPATYNFHAGGTVEIVNPIAITVTGGFLGNCTVTVPGSQTVGTIKFENSGTSKIKMTPNVTSIKYHGSTGLCGSAEEKSNGTYGGVNEWEYAAAGATLRFDP